MLSRPEAASTPAETTIASLGRTGSSASNAATPPTAPYVHGEPETSSESAASTGEAKSKGPDAEGGRAAAGGEGADRCERRRGARERVEEVVVAGRRHRDGHHDRVEEDERPETAVP